MALINPARVRHSPRVSSLGTFWRKASTLALFWVVLILAKS
jgi:hypothetical protein